MIRLVIQENTRSQGLAIIYLFIFFTFMQIQRVLNGVISSSRIPLARFVAAINRRVLPRFNQNSHSIAITMNQMSPGIPPPLHVYRCMQTAWRPHQTGGNRILRRRSFICRSRVFFVGAIDEFCLKAWDLTRIRNDKAEQSIGCHLIGEQFRSQSSIEYIVDKHEEEKSMI